MGKTIGIDLGTTNSVAARAVGIQPCVIDSKEGKPQMRSMVSLKKKKKGAGNEPEILVGDIAEDNWEMAPKDTIISIKRLMGRGVADPEVQNIQKEVSYSIVQPSEGTKDSVRVMMGGKEYSPIDISAMILRKVKEDAEFWLGEEVTHAVITVPAYFSQIQRAATRKAGLQAGLEVTRILDEPTAAAIAFGMEAQQSDEPKYILVYDLGGGTFDISVLMWAGNIFAPLNLQGDMWLGGDNFDQLLLDHVVGLIREEHGVDPTDKPRVMVALRRAVRTAKERLSATTSANIILSGMLQDQDGDLIDVDVDITRHQFEKLIRPLVNRTVSLTKTALINAGLTNEKGEPDPDQIHYVLMAGNSTKVPLVQEAMEQMFGEKKLLRNMNPKNCVAMGAAILAARSGEGWECQAPDPTNPQRVCGHWNDKDAEKCAKCGTPYNGETIEVTVGGIAPFHYGAMTAGDKFERYVQKNDPYPTASPATQTFYTVFPNQRIICIPVYGGESLEKASVNEKQGEAFAILPAGLPANTPVRISIWLDSDGVFKLAASLENGKSLDPWVLEGNNDQATVTMIETVEQAIFENSQSLSLEEGKKIEKKRFEMFEELKRKKYLEAQKCAEDILETLTPRDVDILTKAKNLAGFTKFVVSQFNWIVDTETIYRVTAHCAEVEAKIKEIETSGENSNRTQREEELKLKVNELETELDNLPPDLNAILGIQGAILGPVSSADPLAAKRLLEKFEKAIDIYKKGEYHKSAQLMKEIVEEVEVILEKVGSRCIVCGTNLGGKRYCPSCGSDSWLPQSRTSTSGIIGR